MTGKAAAPTTSYRPRHARWLPLPPGRRSEARARARTLIQDWLYEPDADGELAAARLERGRTTHEHR